MIDAGHNAVLPGFIDMHNDLAYGVLPLWSEPGRVVSWLHNKQWPDADTYTARVTEPAWTCPNAAPEAVLAYVQLRLTIGGATCAQAGRARPTAIGPSSATSIRSTARRRSRNPSSRRW